MAKAIIFDFNRTLYLPEIGKVPEESLALIDSFKEKGFKLALVSKVNLERERLIELYGFNEKFDFIKLVKEKSLEDFEECVRALGVESKEIVVAGDQVKKELKFGKQLGMTTVWFKNGKFGDVMAESEDEKPDFVVNKLTEIENLPIFKTKD